MKKIIKLLSVFIPNKIKRHDFRNWYDEKKAKKQVNYIKSLEGQKALKEIREEFPVVLSTTKTLNEIINNKISICRFGDGEFNLCLNNKKCKNIFQERNVLLKKRLEEILNSKNENILVCISPFKANYKNKELEKIYPYFMEKYWLANWGSIKDLLKRKKYGNALISRTDIFHDNKLENIKKIWENREIVFVYSENGRFEIEERLFDNIKSYEEIFIPALNAFNVYDKIFEECSAKSKDKLFLIAGGPTATVLAYDLSKNNYQALDIGHFPNCYKEFLGEIVSPELLAKYH